MQQEEDRPPVDRAALEAQLRRLAKTYNDGLISDAEYERSRDRLRAQLVHLQQVAPAPDLANAVEVLANLGTIIDAATDEERRALVRSVFSKFWADHEGIKAITPTGIYLPLVGAISLGCVGVADGRQLPVPNPLTFPPIWIAHQQRWQIPA